MISYATEQAGIGAHIDDYDVFLIQSRGSREWAIENKFVTPEQENARLVLDTHINILTYIHTYIHKYTHILFFLSL